MNLCGSCKWWTRERRGELWPPHREYAPCRRAGVSLNAIPQRSAEGSKSLAFPSTMKASANLYTTADFGCIQWQAFDIVALRAEDV